MAMSTTDRTERFSFVCGALSAFLAVAAGAFGAHALRDRLDPELMAIFETGARYQMYGALGLLAASWAQVRWPGPAARAATWLFLAGAIIFSGSLYTLAATGVRAWGAVTPVGGLGLLAGWLALAVAAWRHRG